LPLANALTVLQKLHSSPLSTWRGLKNEVNLRNEGQKQNQQCIQRRPEEQISTINAVKRPQRRSETQESLFLREQGPETPPTLSDSRLNQTIKDPQKEALPLKGNQEGAEPKQQTSTPVAPAKQPTNKAC